MTPPKILFVDDDPLYLQVFRRSLRKRRDIWEMHFATSAKDALRLIENEAIDCVITDVCMPELNGLGLLKQINDHHPTISVILMTGMADADSAVEAFKVGAVDYLIKPVEISHLAEVIENTLSERSHNTGDVPQTLLQRKVGNYIILDTIAKGSMGTVFLVQHIANKKLGALKIINSQLLGGAHHPEILERFRREVEIMSKIQHPNIIPIYGYGVLEEEGAPYLIMAYFEGETLATVITSGRFNLNDKVLIIRKVADALSLLHQHILCHRDLKPGNIMVDSDLRVKLLDFGVIKEFNSTLTQADVVVGTPTYLAPEQIMPSGQDSDCRADIFSLGVVAYELFTGRGLFRATNMMSLATMICQEVPTPLSRVIPDFPEELAAIIMRMLAKRPADRYETMAQVIDALERFINRKLTPQP